MAICVSLPDHYRANSVSMWVLYEALSWDILDTLWTFPQRK